MDAKEFERFMMVHRGIDYRVCDRCRGTGVVTYGSTSTWSGGMGGAAMTSDVCDTCWGSGDADRHWTNLRKLRSEEDHRIREGVAQIIASKCGVGLRSMPACWIALIAILEREERRRKRPDCVEPIAWDALLRMWIGMLKQFVADTNESRSSTRTP